jgi:hypothetical protein
VGIDVRSTQEFFDGVSVGVALRWREEDLPPETIEDLERVISPVFLEESVRHSWNCDGEPPSTAMTGPSPFILVELEPEVDRNGTP